MEELFWPKEGGLPCVKVKLLPCLPCFLFRGQFAVDLSHPSSWHLCRFELLQHFLLIWKGLAETWPKINTQHHSGYVSYLQLRRIVTAEYAKLLHFFPVSELFFIQLLVFIRRLGLFILYIMWTHGCFNLLYYVEYMKDTMIKKLQEVK